MADVLKLGGLNATSMQIINTIRSKAPSQYQEQVPEVTDLQTLMQVGDTLEGDGALRNIFLTSLMNRIARVVIKDANYLNRYASLKKGDVPFGETIEEVFVQIAKAREFNVELAAKREFARTLPDVRTAFHVINWRVQYPTTFQEEDLRKAFLNLDGVTDMLARVLQSLYNANEYDEELLFKHQIIKGIVKGQMKPLPLKDPQDVEETAIELIALASKWTFMGTDYNREGVHTKTDIDDAVIFMDADYYARYGLKVLGKLYHNDMGKLQQNVFLVKDWTSFDHDRFSEIQRNSNQMEEITDEELALMQGVIAVIVDKEWFQNYDNKTKFTENYSAAGDYNNYFLNIEKTISSSPFSNASVLVDSTTPINLPDILTGSVVAKDVIKGTTSLGISVEPSGVLGDQTVEFLNTEDSASKGIAVHPTGEINFPKDQTETLVEVKVAGNHYKASAVTSVSDELGTELTFTKQ